MTSVMLMFEVVCSPSDCQSHPKSKSWTTSLGIEHLLETVREGADELHEPDLKFGQLLR